MKTTPWKIGIKGRIGNDEDARREKYAAEKGWENID